MALDHSASTGPIRAMPFLITEDESWKIIHLREQGLSRREIELNCGGKHHQSQISRVLKYYALFGEPPKYNQHKRHKQAKEFSLDTLAKDRLECIYEEDPCLYLDESTKKLNDDFCYTYSTHAVNQALISRGLHLKEVPNQ